MPVEIQEGVGRLAYQKGSAQANHSFDVTFGHIAFDPASPNNTFSTIIKCNLVFYLPSFFPPLKKDEKMRGDSNLPITVALWLILPVVIRLSQRLSHARLRIKSFL